jgi:site-specific DNA recombinase
MSREHGGFVMSGNVVEIPQSKNLAPIWVQQLRVAAYCRVSTDHEEQQNSLKNQIEFYSDYIWRNPCWQFVAVYYDTASGLRKNYRPGYQQMMRVCRKKKIDLILVKSLSRFGRDTLETIKQIRRLKRMNIGVYIETGGINTLTAH